MNEKKSINSSEQAKAFIKTAKVQNLISQIVAFKSQKRSNKSLGKEIEDLEKFIQVDRQLLSKKITEMIESKSMFAQLKLQPSKLMRKKIELLQEAESVQEKINQIDSNMEITKQYLESEEQTMKQNDEQIQKLNNKINDNQKWLQQIRVIQASQNW